LLAYFLFKALSHRIQDWTIYVTAVLFVLFVGTTDEFIQWMMPRRFWAYKDVGLNMIAGGIFLLAVWKGIKPRIINKPVKKISVKMLVGIITVNLIFLGLCFSNTPDFVSYYSTAFNKLSWLQKEEPMTEYGYKYRDPVIGAFYSRLTLEEIRKTDQISGNLYGKILPKDIISDPIYNKLIEAYSPHTNPFLYEFIIHLTRRDRNFDEFTQTNEPDKKIWNSKVAFKENSLIKKYFTNTLEHSGSVWSDEKEDRLRKLAYLWKGDYVSEAGGLLITSFTLKTVWVVIIILLIIVWTSGKFWGKRLDI
jgi:hypothetical protein